MTADVLREAARLMRDRADLATRGPWTAEAIGSEGFDVFGADGTRAPMKGRARVAQCHWQDWEEVRADSAHIASWHPVVALAVADWLDACASDHDDTPCPAWDHALTVARAYLGDPS